MTVLFKRSAIALIVLGIAGSAAAAVPNSNTLSTQITGVFIGVEGLNFRPMNGDLNYVTAFPDSMNGSIRNHSISTSYDWSWRIFGGIKLTDNDDLTLSWYGMDTSDKDSVSPAGTVDGFGPSAPRWIGGNNVWNQVAGAVSFDLDDAYAVFGHTINFNNPWSVRYAGGLEYANLDSKFRIASDSIYAGESNVGYEAKNETKGLGPRVEFDMTYHLPYGFSLFGNTNAALLVSHRDISLEPTKIISEDRFGTTYINYTTDFSKRSVVIPRFGMRLGAGYSYTWGAAGAEGAARATTLTVDAGWQVDSYIHAIEHPEDGFFDVNSSGGVTDVPQVIGTSNTKVSNFADQGLFVGVNVETDWL